MRPEDIRADLFWPKVDRTGDCWEWQAYRSKKGYGQFRVGKTTFAAHRVAFTLEHGHTPKMLDHICRNRGCVRPAHLRPTTDKQNAENRAATRERGPRGVKRQKGLWVVRVMHYGKTYTAGRGFTNLDDATRAARELRNRLYTSNEEDRV